MSHSIAAVSTGNQICAIGIIRLSGDDCISIAEKVFIPKGRTPLSKTPDRKLILGTLKDKTGRSIDECMAVCSRAPHSYTGEDTVEFHCHGSPAVLSAGLEAIYNAGALPAKRGEFTKRAFLNGQIDLTQAEAVIDLIESETADAAANAAGQVRGVLQSELAPIYNNLIDICSHFHAVIDYPDEDIEDFKIENYTTMLGNDTNALHALLSTYNQGRIIRNGVSAAIVGKPNVGKSSLLNALAGYDRVIVTEYAGTTRDTVEESVLLGSTKLRLIDTAGIRSTNDPIEAMGVERSKKEIENADLVLYVCDGSSPLSKEDMEVIEFCCEHTNVVALINKSDLTPRIIPSDLPFMTIIKICAKTGDGLDLLADTVDEMFKNQIPCDGLILTNTRQYDAIRRAHNAMCASIAALNAHLTPDAILSDIEAAMEAIGEVTGATIREEITARIFERFCVGK